MTKNKIITIISILLLTSIGAAAYMRINQKPKEYKTIYTNNYAIEQIGNEIVKNSNYVFENIANENEDIHNFSMTVEKTEKANSGIEFIYLGKSNSDNQNNQLSSIAKKYDLSNEITYLSASHDDETKEEHDEHHDDETEEEHKEHAKDEDHEHDHGQFDPHIQLSPKRLIELTNSLFNHLNKLPEIDSKTTETFKTNNSQVLDKLNNLDKKYGEFKNYPGTAVVEHNAFKYLESDYGLKTLPIKNSEDADPSVESLQKTVQLIKDQGIKTVLVSNPENKIVKQIITLTNTTSNVISMLEIKSNDSIFNLLEQNYQAFSNAVK